MSSTTHKRYPNVAAYVNELGGSKAHIIEKVLIANNGVAAVKAIRSMRKWAYDVFGNEKAIQFVVMATPEDLRSNAEYIRMGDIIVDVPGGTNNHNYANVTLIVELARLHRVNAVWAGWGHASENPLLPDTLAASNPPIKFIGPSGPPMRALGDKIGSTIIAQTAGVPCIAWNGQNVKADYNREDGCLPEKAFNDACIHSAAEALEAASEIGFPVMIKASEGGGGKGIRMVDSAENVKDAYRQVSGEVPGSPIFIMKLSSNSRHLEVQLLADEYGDAVALNGRDCSVQRRHQKIIEEGPPTAAKPEVWPEMEKAAVSLAKAVGYANAGTVEYLYSEKDSKFYFLELNPRLQVEHPVTEMITHVNLPSLQLQVAMGIPLWNIPDIRELYGKNRFEENIENNQFSFETTPRKPAIGHCIAVRITAENAEAGFKPTSGGIAELNFRSTPNVWGYFSMDSSGSIHEFADSQFGHLFANGKDREQARRNMVLALKELSIRGDISTTIDYVSKLIELDDFIGNNIDTAWLDGLIKDNVGGVATEERRLNRLTTPPHISVILGASIVAYTTATDNEKQFVELLQKGQLPPQNLISMKQDIELILEGVKYILECSQSGQNTFKLSVAGAKGEGSIETRVRLLSDGGYMIQIGGESRIAYLTTKGDAANGMRLNISGANVSFSPDYDPTSLRTDVAGKLVKKLVEDGAKLAKGQAYAEIEVMKMFMPLKVDEAGTITWAANEGAALTPGFLLGNLELENPDNVASVTVHEGALDVPGWKKPGEEFEVLARPQLVLRDAIARMESGMAGYEMGESLLQKVMDSVRVAIADPLLAVYEIDENLSVLNGRIDATLFETITKMLADFRKECVAAGDDPSQLRFPAGKVVELLDEHEATLEDSDLSNFTTLTTPLRESAIPYTKSSGMSGSERALSSFLEILRTWVSVERWFCENISYADAVDELRRVNSSDFDTVLKICRSHSQLSSTSIIVKQIMDVISESELANETGSSMRASVLGGAQALSEATPVLSEIGALTGNAIYDSVALIARKLLLKERMPSIALRQSRVSSVVDSMLDYDDEEKKTEDLQNFMEESVPMTDIVLPLLKNASDVSVELGLVDIYARKLYQSHIIKESSSLMDKKAVKMTFMTKPNESIFSATTPVTSMTDLTRIVSRSNSLAKLSDYGAESDSDATTDSNTGGLFMHRSSKIPPNTQRTGVFKVVKTLDELSSIEAFDDLLQTIPQYCKSSPRCQAGPINVLHIFAVDEAIPRTTEGADEFAKRCEEMLTGFQNLLAQADVRRVTFKVNYASEYLVDGEGFQMPAIFTFRARSDFKEDSLFRDIEPSHAYNLDLMRLAKNFSVRSISSSQTTNTHVHLYRATPKKTALLKDKKASPDSRVFVRAMSYIEGLNSVVFEQTLVDAFNALDLSASENSSVHPGGNNHLFINFVSDEKVVLDAATAEKAALSVLKRHSDRLKYLGLAEVEIRIVCCLEEDSPMISLRMVATNPTGYVQVLNTYVESSDETNTKNVFKRIGGTKSSMSGTGDSSWEEMDVNTPYPLTRPFEAQRKAALRSTDTLYCYDIPSLFEAAVEQQWVDAAQSQGADSSSIPSMIMYSSELIVQRKDGGSEWSMDDYSNGDLEMVQVQRGAGSNDVGMVAWLMVLKTVEYPDGRQVVLIANDITYKAGSFGTKEDVVFKMASEFARERRIPRLYVAANSGARIGTADSVKKVFKVSFKDDSKPENGFNFLYVTKDDYERLALMNKAIVAEPTTLGADEVYKITDIIGTEPDLGVENLKGSGLIAGETSSAYNDIFTLTIVLGRTVGIGAYLVRLGQRTIQKKSQSPIILTGYQALNKLMGVDVYSTNDQLGGPAIMYPNGVSHTVADNHLLAVNQALDWLSYVPSMRGGLLPITDIQGIDSIERNVEFCPSPGVPYDPRYLLTGVEGDDGVWQGGFFDKGSFNEALSGWAKSVVVGRARLGGIPMGVIVTENRTAEAVKPADPADVTASEAVIQQAGCVWFPNSAYKTAQAINDFRGEDLPLMIFANWRGFSGGQRDMFDEVLKYGSMIVDAFVAYEQPVFVLIPPHAEVRGGAWVVLDPSINSSVMEMYATAKTARGGVLEANGAASVKYRVKDLLKTMHRLDDKLVALDAKLEAASDAEKAAIASEIKAREQSLLPLYEQIAVQFCDLHDTPGRMQAVGVIEKAVEWEESRNFFFWRLRRKLAEFDLRKKMQEASVIGRGLGKLSPIAASSLMKKWFMESTELSADMWKDDKTMLAWMAQSYEELEERVKALNKDSVVQEVFHVLTGGGQTSAIGTAGLVEGISKAYKTMSPEEKESFKKMMEGALA